MNSTGRGSSNATVRPTLARTLLVTEDVFGLSTPLRWFLWLILAAGSMYAAYVQGQAFAESFVPRPTEKPTVYYMVEAKSGKIVEARPASRLR
jgi:hypothetical protein